MQEDFQTKILQTNKKVQNYWHLQYQLNQKQHQQLFQKNIYCRQKNRPTNL